MTVVIIGAGHAGGRAAEALREAKYPGSIILIGEESHLPYERPPLSKSILLDKQTAEAATLLPASFYAANKIELRLGIRAIRIRTQARQVDLADGSSVAYEKLILATGLRPRRLQGFDIEGRMFCLRSLDDARQIRPRLYPGARLLIVGGGFLGLELAATARQLGCTVTVSERHVSPLYKAVASVVGEYVMDLHRRNGVEVLSGVMPRQLKLAPDGQEVHAELTNGLHLAVDTVITATGSIPNTELAETAGLNVQDGVMADQFGRTSDPHIYAVGDVSRHFNPILERAIRVESWQNAQNQAIATARAIAGSAAPYSEVPWFWTDQYNMNLQIVGYPHSWDALAVHGEPSADKFTVLYLSNGRVVGANMVNNGRDTRLMRQWVEQGARVDPALVEQPGLALKNARIAEAPAHAEAPVHTGGPA